MSRFKQLMVGRISQRNYNDQVGEVMAYVSVINKLLRLLDPGLSDLVRTPHNVCIRCQLTYRAH